MIEKPRYLIAGDRALVVEFGDQIDPATNARVRRLDQLLESHPIEGVLETVPTFRSLLVVYDPLFIRFDDLVLKLEELESEPAEPRDPKQTVIIPTVYGGDFGPDIHFVARHNQISVDEVIRLHTSREYLVYMIGFTPGFPYLGGLPRTIAAPRLQTPRTKVPAGSVGIAGEQTGIYPTESPGGWQLIGRTPLKLFDPNKKNPVLLVPGDRVRFEPIDERKFMELVRL
ncbi:MAG: 5-oxoprolinase subunit PxpB [Acidobacteria bacterium]|nr:MAG: 5-oxoprolinase subunit PxpB [Acidobacteriota bacterium]